MRKTDTLGTMFPGAKLHLNTAAGTQFCVATGTAELSIVLSQYTLNCTTSATISMTSSDRFYLWTGVNMTVGPANKALQAELDIEGTTNGNYDSRVTVPMPVTAPSITGLTPSTGQAGTSVTVAGTGYRHCDCCSKRRDNRPGGGSSKRREQQRRNVYPSKRAQSPARSRVPSMECLSVGFWSKRYKADKSRYG